MSKEQRWSTTWALAGYLLVICSLTIFKGFYHIGPLWRPERQRVRRIEPIPFDMLLMSRSWFAPNFEYVGNIGLFVPFGALVVVACGLWGRADRLRRATLIGFALSLCLEVLQFLFALGRSDIDDLMCNTFGTFLGAWLALRRGPDKSWWWIGLGIVLTFVFAGIVVLAGGF